LIDPLLEVCEGHLTRDIIRSYSCKFKIFISLFGIVKVRDETRDSGITIHRGKVSKQEQGDRIIAETTFFGVSVSQKVSKK